jgi:hypothetical protein
MTIKKISFNQIKSDDSKPYLNYPLKYSSNNYCPTKIYALSDQELLNIMFSNILNYSALSTLAFRILLERKYIKLIIKIDHNIIDPDVFILYNSDHRIDIDIIINNKSYPIINNIIIKNNVKSIYDYFDDYFDDFDNYSDDESSNDKIEENQNYHIVNKNANIDFLRIEDDKIKIYSYRRIIYNLEKIYYAFITNTNNNYSSYNIYKYIVTWGIAYYLLKSFVPSVDINNLFKQKLKN